MLSSQIGKTEVLLNGLLYAFGNDPGPSMCVMPTLEIAGSFSTDRLTPALRNCPPLAASAPRSRTTGDAILHKRIAGSPLSLCGANSPASLASRPVRFLSCDEIDHWPAATAEGDPLALAIQRTAAFRRRKIVLASTPTVKFASRIEDWFARSDQRELWPPCPRCGGRFVVAWKDVVWESGAPDSARLVCPLCRGRIEDGERPAMFAAAEWRAGNPDVTRIRGYRAWAIVSPWLRLSELVESLPRGEEAARHATDLRQPQARPKLGSAVRACGVGWPAPTP